MELTTPGRRGVSCPLSLVASSPDLSGHLACFDGYFGYKGDHQYQHTIFRFPLRRSSSEISESVHDVSSVRDKLFYPLMREAEHAMLFLKNVTSIEMFERVAGAQRSLFRAEIPSVHRDNVVKYRNEINKFVSSEEYISTTKVFVCLFPTQSWGVESEKREVVWLLLNIIGFGAEDSELRQFHLDQHLDHLPWVGMALSTGVRDLSCCGRWSFEWNYKNPSHSFDSINQIFHQPFLVDPLTALEISTGRIFCFLPTQLDSKFPFHLHGYFSLSSNRRALPWPAEDNESHVGARWNFLLAQNLASTAYSVFLFISMRALSHPSPLQYHYQLLSRWSPHDPDNTLFNSILCGGLQKLSNHLLLYSKQSGGKWLSVSEGIFLPSLFLEPMVQEEICLGLLESLDQPVICIPDFIRDILLNIPRIRSQMDFKKLTPVLIRDLLRDNSNTEVCIKFLSLRENSVALLEVVLSYLTGNESPQCVSSYLEGVPLLLTAGTDGRTEVFSSKGNKIFISSDTATHLRVFPGLESQFVDPTIPKHLHSALLSIARRVNSLNLHDVTHLLDNAALFVDLLTDSLSCFFAVQPNTTISWRPHSNQPPPDWIYALFDYIGSSQAILSAISHLPILPRDPITNEVIPLLPLVSKNTYIERSGSESMKHLETSLELTGCIFCHKHSFIQRFSDFVLPPTPVGLIVALKSENVLNSFISVLNTSEEEFKFELIELLIPLINKQNLNIIKQLPLFLNTLGQWLILRSDTLFPPYNIPSDIQYPPHILSPFNQSVNRFCEKLHIIPESTEPFIQTQLLPHLVSTSDSAARNRLTLWILDSVRNLSSNIVSHLKHTEWLLDASTNGECSTNVKLHSPSQLLDPRDSLLTQVLPVNSGDYFPNTIYEDSLDDLKKFLGLRYHGTLTPELATRISNSCVSKLQTESGNEWCETFRAIVNLLSKFLGKFDVSAWKKIWPIFRNSCFILSNANLPGRWPVDLSFCKSKDLSSPESILVCRDEDLFLVGCVRNTFIIPGLADNDSHKQVIHCMGFLTSITSETVIEQLNFLIRIKTFNICDSEFIHEMVYKIYCYLDANSDSLIGEIEPNCVFIQDQGKFVARDHVVFKTPFDLKPHIFSLQELNYNSNSLFQRLKISQSPTVDQLASILSALYISVPILSSEQLDLVISILTYLIKQESVTTNLEIYVPGKNLKLYKPHEEEFVFCDQSWLNRSLIEEDFVFVHERIPNDTAYKLGVCPFSEKIAPPSDVLFEESGQQILVTDRIRGILDGYYGNINVLKEMMQNADDAKATELNVVFDWRNHPCDSLLSPSLQDWQGPAILFYNNSTFSDRDFENIMKIEGATKLDDKTTIGRFGLGFCTVYHLTDLPSFVSRNYIHILDPHKRYIGSKGGQRGGVRIDFCHGRYAKYIQLYQDQFAPYEDIFSCGIKTLSSFNGTLFRLPLRTNRVSSKISLTVFDTNDILQLQESFIKEAETLIFFTQHIESLGIYTLHSDATPKSLKLLHLVKRSALIKSPSAQPFLHAHKDLMNRIIDGCSVSPAISTCQYKLSVTNKSDTNWVVSYATGSGACVDVLKKFTRAKAPLPFAGVAYNLNIVAPEAATGYQSNLYCFLPLPIKIALPFHCHAMFELRSERQGLVDTAEAKTEWNKVVVSDALVSAALALYRYLVDEIETAGNQEPHQKYLFLLFNVFSQHLTKDPLWSGFTDSFSKQLLESVHHFFLSDSRSGYIWGNFYDTNFINNLSIKTDLREYYSPSFSTTMRDVLVGCGFLVAIVPECSYEYSGLLRYILEYKTKNIINLARFTQIFFSNLFELDTTVTLEVLDILISACGPINWLIEVISSSNCIPCGDTGMLQAPRFVVDPNNKIIARLYESKENRLPTEQCHQILFKEPSPALTNLKKYFYILSSKLSPDELASRANYIHKNCNGQLALSFIEYLNQNTFTGSEIEEIRSALCNLPFIPVECPSLVKDNILTYECKFVSPIQIIPYCFKQIVELQLPVFPATLIVYHNFISHMNISESNLPMALPIIAIKELTLCIQYYGLLTEFKELKGKLSTIYETLGKNFRSYYQEISQIPLKRFFIPSVGFCEKTKLLLSSNEDFSPYIHSISSYYEINTSTHLREFFISSEVTSTLSVDQCRLIIEELFTVSKDRSLNAEEQRIAIRFLKELSSSPLRDDAYMLGIDNCIHLAVDCVFHDLSWDKRDYSTGAMTHRGKTYHFVHRDVTHDMAFRIGVKPLSHVKLSARKELPFAYQSGGQSEPLTTRLKNILCDYESDVDVFKELTQNADDAQASEVKFLFDYSMRGTESLMSERMKCWQGPAIYCYNDSTFSDADFTNITKIAARSKISDKTTIGAFGIGFNTVYHFTDLPSFVSRRLLHIFDPHVSYLEGFIPYDRPGMQIDFVEACDDLKEFEDQFSVYNGVFGCDFFGKKEYAHTLFRLPLRTAEVSSRISQKCFNSQESIRELQDEFVHIAKNMIIFLQNIKSIELYERTNTDETTKLVYRVTREPEPIRFFSDNKVHFENLLAGRTLDPVTKVGCIQLSTQFYSETESKSELEEILVSYASGTEKCFSLVNEIKGQHEVSALPICSVAIPTYFINMSCGEFSEVKCFLFCFLPIPSLSSYPMHINGSFQLQQSRRALHSTSDGSIRTRWNQALISDALPISLVNALLFLAERFPHTLTTRELERYYSFWPESDQSNLLWNCFSSAVALRIIASNAPVFYCSIHRDRWISINQVSFFVLPTHHELGISFIEFIFFLASQSGVYFADICPGFTNHLIMKFIAEQKPQKQYSLQRVCNELIFNKLPEIMNRDIAFLMLILSTLLPAIKYEPWLRDLFIQYPCIPCGEVDPVLIELHRVVNPFSQFTAIFYPEDRTLPYSIFEFLFDPHTSPECSQVLNSLNIISTKLPIEVLFERCEMALEIHQSDPQKAMKHVSCILDYLNTMKPDISETGKLRNGLWNISFIPVCQDQAYMAISPETQVVFSSPSKCYEHSKRVYLTPEYHAVTEEVNSLRHALSLLGISPKEVSLNIALQSILYLQANESKIKIFEDTEISDRLEAVYLFIAQHCFLSPEENEFGVNDNRKLVQFALTGVNWIWHQTFKQFYSADQIILSTEYMHFKSRFLPTFPYTQLIERIRVFKFFEFMKLQKTVTPETALDIISRMKQHFADDPLPYKISPEEIISDDCGVVIHLINSIVGKSGVPDAFKRVYLLTETCTLKIASHLYQNDIPWVDVSNEDRATLVHHDITLLSSYKLGAKSRMDTMYNLEWSDFGQHEKITNRIENLLREFPCDVTIFKELLQNADDAGASEIAFVLDCQEYGDESLCLSAKYHKNWKQLQKIPSLLVYNNRPFTENDLKGIQEVGIGGKQEKNTIGRFGLGFNSVYHLTRCPCLLTCSEDGLTSNFCVFDPYQEHLNIPPGKLPGFRLQSKTSKLAVFGDQLSPYFAEAISSKFDDTFSNIRENKSFSMFRLPLNAIKGSKLNINANVKITRSLIEDLIREAPRLLPFIKNVSLIRIYEVNSNGIANCKSVVNSLILTQKNIKVPRPIAGYSKSIQVISKKIIVEEPLYIEGRVAARGSTEVEWLIYHFSGNVEIFFGSSSLLKKYSRIYQTEKLLLFSSLAVEVVCKDCEKPTQKRHLYCHLPFGNPLDFPIHINAPFILDPHRRYVSYQDQLTKNSSWDSIWHGEILKQVLIPLYFQFLVDLGPGGRKCSDLPDDKYFEWYYSLFPVIQPTDHGSNSMEFLQALGRGVMNYILQVNSKILLADDIGQCDVRTWYPLHGSDAGIFKMVHSPLTKLIDLSDLYLCLVKLRYHLTSAPEELAQSFMACTQGKEQCKFLTPLSALSYMNKNSVNFSKGLNHFPCHMDECILTVEQIKTLLTFVLSHYDKDPMANTQMKQIPLKIDFANNLGKFKQSKHSTFKSTYAALLPYLQTLFLAETYDSKLVNKLTDCGYVEELNAIFLSSNLRVPGDISKYFFLLFWSFIVREVHDSHKLNSLFSHFQLAPITYGLDAPDFPTFTEIRNLRFVATDQINDPLRSVLYKLQCPFLCFSPFDIYDKSRPQGIIHLYSIRNYMNSQAVSSEVAMNIIKCISMAKEIEIDLTENEAELLRNLFPSVNFDDLQRNDFRTLSRLKIYLSDNGPRGYNLVALSNYNVCFINDNFPICQNLSTELSDRYQLGILTANAYCNNPCRLIQEICTRTNKGFIQLDCFIRIYILQQELFSCLDFESQSKILIFLFNDLQKESWITKLKSLAFIHIPSVSPFYFQPTKLYCPNIELFGTFKKDYLLPQKWAQSNQLYQIMLKLGLNTIISLPLIIDSASYIATNGIDCLSPGEMLYPINALKQYLQSKYSDMEEENSCLEQLAQIPFLPMSTLTTFRTQDDSGRDWRLGCFYEAQLEEHMEYCCSAAPILHYTVSFYRPYDEESHYIFDRAMAWLRVNLVPNIQLVKDHLQNLIETFKTFSIYEIESLTKYFYATYRYLGSSHEELPEFEHADCILYRCKLFTPQNILFKIKYTYYPYLFQCPNELLLYRNFLHKLRVAEFPTYKSYNFVLTCIKESFGNEKLDPNNHKLLMTTERAFSNLIFELRKIEPDYYIQLDIIYVLTVDYQLIPCQFERLYYDDDHQLLTRVSKFGQNFKILASLDRSQIGSFAPPERLGIKRLTQRFHQYLLPNVYQNNRVEDELATRLRDRFKNSHELIFKALQRIYYHDTNENLCNVRIRNKEVEYERDPNRDEQFSIKSKLGIIELVAVHQIDLRIDDIEGGTFTIPDACICFLDGVNNNILFKSDQSCRDRLPIEMAYELDQYFGNLFQKSLIYLEICLVYPLQEIMNTLDNFKIAKLPNYFDVHDQD